MWNIVRVALFLVFVGLVTANGVSPATSNLAEKFVINLVISAMLVAAVWRVGYDQGRGRP